MDKNPDPRRNGKSPLHVWLPDALTARIDAAVEKERRTKTAFVELWLTKACEFAEAGLDSVGSGRSLQSKPAKKSAKAAPRRRARKAA